MKDKFKFLGVLAIILSAGYYLYSTVVDGNNNKLLNEKEVLLNISESLKIGQVSKVEVFYMPLYLETPVAMRPENIFSGPSALTILGNTVEADRLSKALRSTRISTLNSDSNVRVGFIAYDASGKKMASLALGVFNDGYLNGTPCHFSRNLKKVLVDLADPSRNKGLGYKERIGNFLLENR